MTFKKHQRLAGFIFLFMASFQIGLILFHIDGWPLSQYAMFSKPKFVSDTTVFQFDIYLKNSQVRTVPWGGDRISTIVMRDFVESNLTTTNPIIKKKIEQYMTEQQLSAHEIAEIYLVKVDARMNEKNQRILRRQSIRTLRLQ